MGAKMRKLGVMVLVCGWSAGASAATLQVGPGQTYAMPCDAIAAAEAGDVIEIDAAGSYDGDVCTFPGVDGLTVRGVNGRPHIDAAGANAGGKAVWVVTGNDTVIENVEISGCTVPDGNGAAIRQEGTNLTLRSVFFHDNENGILAGADPDSEILIEYSEFAHNGLGDVGYTHNMYINDVKKFTLRYSWSHDVTEGHLFKSRAEETHVLYNRLSDESGASSRNIDLPNGGVAYVIGNLIEQGPEDNANRGVIGFGQEGLPYADNELYVVNNTVVTETSQSATFIDVADGSVVVRNNIFVGPGSFNLPGGAVNEGNFMAPDDGDPMLADQANLDYHLLRGSLCVDGGVDPGIATAGDDLTPTSHYVHPAMGEDRVEQGDGIDIGAYELDGGAPPDDDSGGSDDGTVDSTGGGGDDNGATSGGDTDGGDGMADDGDSSADTLPATGDGTGSDTEGASENNDDSGCGCHTHGRTPLSLALLLLVVPALRRRR